MKFENVSLGARSDDATGVFENIQGNTQVSGARAARAVADALVTDPRSQGVIVRLQETGKAAITARRAGVFDVDIERIARVNSIEPAISLSTVSNLSRVSAGMTLASVRILSDLVDLETLTRTCVSARQGVTEALRVHGVQHARATLIETHHPGGRIAPNGRRFLDERLDRLGASLHQVSDVPHTSESVAGAIASADGDVIFVLTPPDFTNGDNVVEDGLRDAGGHVDRLGVPVDPGSRLLIGSHAGRHVLGLPDAARSPAFNGADPILERLLCGVPVSGDDIAHMGVGGLIIDQVERGLFR